MRVITNRRLVEFSLRHPDAGLSLQTWRKLIESNEFGSFAELRRTFGAVDVHGEKYIFDVRGNHYRIIAWISFTQQICYIKHVLTHAEYDKGKWK